MAPILDLFAAARHEWVGLIAMGLLILLSAFFSGSEAALFSLREIDRQRIRLAGAAGQRVGRLIADPENLLSAILFWNLLINMTYFAIATILGSRLEATSEVGSTGAVVFTVVSLLAIIFLSEMLPKSIAVLSPMRSSLMVASPLSVAIGFAKPILPVVNVINQAAHRLIWPSLKPEPDLDLADIDRAVELGTDDAALLQRERGALRELVAMSETRADELMRPRGRLAIVTAPLEQVVLADGSPLGGYLHVVNHDDETIVASIPVRRLRPSQLEDLTTAAEPVVYVAWSAKVSQVYDRLTKDGCQVAIVVNEFGESIGAISVDDILYRLLSPSDSTSEGDESIVVMKDGRLQLAGSVSLRTLTKFLSIERPEEGTATVAGYIQRQNERLPRVGDSSDIDGYRLVVIEEDSEGIRIEVQPPGNVDGDVS